MSKKIITLVEDDETISSGLKRIIEDTLDDNVEVMCFATGDEFYEYSQGAEFKNLVRAQIFDLANTKLEAAKPGDGFKISSYIRESYNTTRVPIILYSGFVEDFTEFDNYGTVFKIAKTTGTSTGGSKALCALLELMYKTGFLEIFSPNGVLEAQHPSDLHEVFTGQFKGNGNELKEILTTLHSCHGDECQDRVAAVFQRIGLRALINRLHATPEPGKQNLTVNVLEHFYRRINLPDKPVWTGDIFQDKNSGKRVYVMSPKCDLAWLTPEKKEQLKVFTCALKPYPIKTRTRKEIETQLKHTPSIDAKSRIVPPSTFYPNGGAYPEGSAVDFTDASSMLYNTLATDYNYLVTLSDDFVNEIVTRFSAYLMRPGIADIDAGEFEIGQISSEG